MEETRERTIRWPCRADSDALRGLEQELLRKHGDVRCSLITEFGPYADATNVSLDDLLRQSIALRWRELHFSCANKDVRVTLRDSAYREVTIAYSPASESAMDSLRTIEHIVRSWRRWSLLPAHFLLLLFFASLIYAAINVAQYYVADTPDSPATVSPTRSGVAKAPGTAVPPSAPEPGVRAPPPSNNWLASTVRSAIAIVLAIFVGFVCAKVLGWIVGKLAPPWSRLFPAFYFDIPACRHHYRHSAVLAFMVMAIEGTISWFIATR